MCNYFGQVHRAWMQVLSARARQDGLRASLQFVHVMHGKNSLMVVNILISGQPVLNASANADGKPASIIFRAASSTL